MTQPSLRGLVYAVYTRDDRVTKYAKQVQANYAIDPLRGWEPLDSTERSLFPWRSNPRRVFGVSPTTGRRNHTIVAHPDAPLWTGAANTFQCETDHGTSDDYQVTRRVGEAFASPHFGGNQP